MQIFSTFYRCAIHRSRFFLPSETWVFQNNWCQRKKALYKVYNLWRGLIWACAAYRNWLTGIWGAGLDWSTVLPDTQQEAELTTKRFNVNNFIFVCFIALSESLWNETAKRVGNTPFELDDHSSWYYAEEQRLTMALTKRSQHTVPAWWRLLSNTIVFDFVWSAHEISPVCVFCSTPIQAQAPHVASEFSLA